MKAIITRPFSFAPEGHTTIVLAPGAVLTGAWARLAVEAGCANEVKIQEPLETHYEPGAHEVRFDEPAPAPKKSRRKSKDT